MTLYTATVESLTRGWTYTAVEGEEADPTEPVQWIAPLSFQWKLESEVPPAQLEPTAAELHFAGMTAGDLPAVDIGDLIKISVRYGTTGPYIIDPPPFLVTSAEATLTPRRAQTYKARLRIAMSDLLSELATLYPITETVNLFDELGYLTPSSRFRVFISEVAKKVNRTIGVPTSWSDLEGSDNAATGLRIKDQFTGSGLDELQKWLRSYAPEDMIHVLTPAYLDSHPTGYEKAGPPTGTTNWGPGTAEAQATDAAVSTTRRYYIVPASKNASGTDLPLTVDVVGGVLTLVPVATTPDGHSRIAIDAAHCRIPAVARRSREHLVNFVRLKGTAAITPIGGSVSEGPYERDYVVEGAAVHGKVGREVDVYLFLGSFPSDASGENPPGPPALAPHYAGEIGGGAWALDKFQLVTSTMPTDEAELLLPRIAPRFLGEEDGDEQVLRHVAIYHLDDSAAVAEGSLAGFIVAGSMTITGGDIIWDLNVCPGSPVWTGTEPALTYSEFETAVSGLAYEDIDPRIAYDDMTYADV